MRGTLDSFWDALVHDPQTSGGLLIAVDGGAADELVERLRDAGVEHATRIGEVRASDQPFLESSEVNDGAGVPRAAQGEVARSS